MFLAHLLLAVTEQQFNPSQNKSKDTHIKVQLSIVIARTEKHRVEYHMQICASVVKFVSL